MMKELLVIIDPQKAYQKGGVWQVVDMESVEKNIIKLMEKYQDFIILKEINNPEPNGTWKIYQEAYANVTNDTTISELTERFKPYEDKVMIKYTFSAFSCPQFVKLVKQYNRLIITGVQTECCIMATLIDGMREGIEQYYVKDACSGRSMEMIHAAEAIIEGMPIHIKIKTTEELLKANF